MEPRADLPALEPLAVGDFQLENNLVAAPMAGVSNLPFRLISREAGAALTFTETVSAKGLVMGGRKTRRLLQSSAREAPVAFQLFGSEPAVLADACRILEQEEGAAWIDLNMGCPVKKFIRNRAGSALLQDPPRAARIVAAMRRSFSGVLSVKMRSGWDQSSIARERERKNQPAGDGRRFRFVARWSGVRWERKAEDPFHRLPGRFVLTVLVSHHVCF